MRWDERRNLIRATYGEAILVALVLCMLAVLAVASKASAQTPQPLPVTNVTAPRVSYAPGQSAEIRGVIISRDGDDMWIRDDAGNTDVVTLTADTRITSPSGLFNLDKRRRDVTELLPGLIVKVKGSGGDRGNLLADRISFHSSALKVARQIAAGDIRLDQRIDATTDSLNALRDQTRATFDTVKSRMAEAEQRARDSLAAINVRFDDIGNYNVRDSATVLFATGSADLTSNGKARLDGIASTAMGMNGFMIEVTGFTDNQGGEMMNQRLSERRAEAVVSYLRSKDIPLRRIMNPTGFGESDPVASNSTAQGRMQNRRADVRVLINAAMRPK